MRSLKKSKSGVAVELASVEREVDEPTRDVDGKITVEEFRKSISNMLYGKGTIERLSFDFDPRARSDYGSIYRPKLKLLPDDVLKQVSIRDSLVAAIIMARQNHLAPFGRPRADRFSVGIDVEPDKDYLESLNESERKAFKARCIKARDLLVTCGHTTDLQEDRQSTLSEWFEASVRSVLTVGRLATEVVYRYDEEDKDHERPVFNHFVATDAGTVYYAARGNRHEELEAQRKAGLLELRSALGEKIDIEDYLNGTNKYSYVQVVHGLKFTVFTAKEMRWRNFYPAVDIELDGYPITPIDTVIGSITTHLNIGTHNRLYFQSGRATRGMLVVQSDDVTPQQLKSIKSKFKASIDSVNNSWRMPIFGIGKNETIQWQQMDSTGSRDMEFQYLVDLNAREILTAFMMSPDELPGWAYLSRGTNSQALSEGNNEYKLEAARDVGIRPLCMKFEDFLNSEILPEIDPSLVGKAAVRLQGLDADDPSKEAARLEQDSKLWLTQDGIHERVEVKPVGVKFGGAIPLSPAFQAILWKTATVGEILAELCGREDARNDPNLQYYADDAWFQFQQMKQAQEQAQQQAQQQAQMAQQQGAPGGGGAPPAGGGGGGSPDPSASGGAGSGPKAYSDAQTEGQKTAASDSASASGQGASGGGGGTGGGGALARSIDQAMSLLSKGEATLPPELRRLLSQAKATEGFALEGLEADLRELDSAVRSIAIHHAPPER
jgi:hypothetical protein